MTAWTKLSRLRSAEAFAERLAELEIDLPFDTEPEAGPASPLA